MAKPYKEYTFADLQRLDYSFLTKDKAADIQESQKSAFNYILMMAGEFGVNVHGIGAMTHFDNGTGKDLITDRNVINQRIMALKGGEALPMGIEGLPSRAVEASKDLIIATKRNYAQDITRSENQITSQLANIRDYQAGIDGFWSTVMNHRDKIHDMRILAENNKDDDTILKQIIAIEATGMFKFLKYEPRERMLSFGMTAPCRLSYVKKIHSIDIKDFNMGYFGISFRLNDSRVTGFCGPHTICAPNNQSASRHPHLSSDGNSYTLLSGKPEVTSICWGNMQNNVDKLRQEKNYLEICKMYVALMNTYCHANPYQSLGWYVDQHTNAVERSQEIRRGLNGAGAELWSVVSLETLKDEDGKIHAPYIPKYDVSEELKFGDVVWIHKYQGTDRTNTIGVVVQKRPNYSNCDVSGSSTAYTVAQITAINTNGMNRLATGDRITTFVRGRLQKLSKSEIKPMLIEKISRAETSINVDSRTRVCAGIEAETMFLGTHINRIGRDSSATRVIIGRYDESRLRYSVKKSGNSYDTTRIKADEISLAVEHFDTVLEYMEYMTASKLTQSITDTLSFKCCNCGNEYDVETFAEDCCEDSVEPIAKKTLMIEREQ